MPDLNPYDWFASLGQILAMQEMAGYFMPPQPRPTPTPTPSPRPAPGLGPYAALSQAGLGQAAAGPLTPAGTVSMTGGFTMTFPFPSSYYTPSNLTEKFGQAGPNGSHEMGNDYQMPVGTPIYAPFDGTISVEDQGKRNWGKRIFVTGPNGVVFAIGHLHEFAIHSGSVHAGQIIGYSGGAMDDPSSGNSTGSHVETQLLIPTESGGFRYIDPAPWLSGVFSGNPVAIPGLPSGSAAEPQQPAGAYVTPDGHYIVPGTQDDRFYKMADAVWTKIYASHPPWSVVQALMGTGVQNTDQLTGIINGMPSHIAGWSIGQYETMKGATDNYANKFFGRPVPDSLMREFAAQGITTPDQAQLWFMSHPAASLPKEDYQAVFDLANAQTQAVWGVPPHPTDVANAWQAAQTTSPPQQQVATVGKPAHV